MKALDTNVVVRFLIGDDPVMKAKALRMLEDAADMRDVMQVRNEIDKEGTVSLEEIKKRYVIE